VLKEFEQHWVAESKSKNFARGNMNNKSNNNINGGGLCTWLDWKLPRTMGRRYLIDGQLSVQIE
jgi:hypothetical protein